MTNKAQMREGVFTHMKALTCLVILALFAPVVNADWVELDVSQSSSQANIDSSAYGGTTISDGSSDLSILWDGLTDPHLNMYARMCDTSKTSMTTMSYVHLIINLKTNGSNYGFNLVTSLQYIEYTSVLSPNLDDAYYSLEVLNHDTGLYTQIGNRSDEGVHDYNVSLSSSHMDGSGFINIGLNITQTTQDCEAYNQLRAYEFKVLSEMNTNVDSDGDGVGDEDDLCPNTPPGAEVDSDGCAMVQKDSDQDSYNDLIDAYPNDPTQHLDSDGDGCGDNTSGTNGDAFPNDSTQCNDTDGDGYGDNQSGVNPDVFPLDSTQWEDSDGDGYGDNQSGNDPDAFVLDPTQWMDSDGDGYGDNQSGNNPDAYVYDGTQWSDNDGDGWGDNPNGNNPDAFPNDANEWFDSDNDGVGDNADDFPNDLTQYLDSDGDGYGDNSTGNNADAFPDDLTQWRDLDGDGCGDNTSGTNGDVFPNDSTQCNDSDGDGYGDNQSGLNPDVFPLDSTQWEDYDGDRCGDNPNGSNPDEFPADSTQCIDSDKDGYGDNPDGNNGDDCKNTPSGMTVNKDGCAESEIDDDGDGIKNDQDDCPNTPFGVRVLEDGCEEAIKVDSQSEPIQVVREFVSSNPVPVSGGLMLAALLGFLLFMREVDALFEPEPTDFEFIEYLEDKQGIDSDKKSPLVNENETYKHFLANLRGSSVILENGGFELNRTALDVVIERMESKVYVPIGAVVCFRGLMTLFARERESQLAKKGIPPSGKRKDGKEPSGKSIFEMYRNPKHGKLKNLKKKQILPEFPELYQQLFDMCDAWNNLIHMEDHEYHQQPYNNDQMERDVNIMNRFIDVVLNN